MTRLEAVLEDPLFKEYLLKNNKNETERKFCRHTFQHYLDVARITYILILESGNITAFMEENDLNRKLAKELIYTAAILHDIGRWREYETGEDHSLVGAELAEGILERAGFNEKEKSIITSGIREHRRGVPDRSLLGKYLHRADGLSRLCTRCEARDECFKVEEMETGRKPLIY
ncbi:MAG: phosphohydrolase [Firmicutes bacterium HGW-Firmicutes-14]|nr:MAG: phosphohydrolase [Firmicutes bacterium HGW-Firmicutes-14]